MPQWIETLIEAFTKYNYGVTAALGATRSSYTTANHGFDKKLIDKTFNSSVNKLGDIINDSRVYMINTYGTNGIFNAKIYVIQGDPSLNLWTNTINEYSNVSLTDNGSSIFVNSNISGSKITVTSGGDSPTYFSTIDNTTSSTFSTSVRPLYITVTKENYKPYMAITGGTLSKDEEWYGEMTLLGDIVIPSGKTLTIDSGTEINLNGNEITSNGTIDGIDFIATPDVRLVSGTTVLGLYQTITNAFDDGATVEVRGVLNSTNHVTVSSTKTLKPQNNSVLKFASGKYLNVYGTMNAEDVTFNSTSGTWGGIRYYSGSTGGLDDCSISNASYGVYTNSVSPTIENCTIINCTYGIYAYNSSPTIEANEINSSKVYLNNSDSNLDDNYLHDEEGSYAMYMYNSDPVLYDNTISSDAMVTIQTDGSNPEFGESASYGYNELLNEEKNDGVLWADNGSYVLLGYGPPDMGPYYASHNTIIGGEVPLYTMDQDSEIDATHCWWGSTTVPMCMGDVDRWANWYIQNMGNVSPSIHR